LLTHLHWDHAGNCDLFKEARVLAQESELRYALVPGRFAYKAFLSPLSGWPHPPYLLPNLDVVRGEAEIRPGIKWSPFPDIRLVHRRSWSTPTALRHRPRRGLHLREPGA
jgi:glyoxylase-like metal-dependent hydrolase (beta-lactamase superfamily II)